MTIIVNIFFTKINILSISAVFLVLLLYSEKVFPQSCESPSHISDPAFSLNSIVPPVLEAVNLNTPNLRIFQYTD